MKVDQWGAVVRQKDGYPGDIGDACADTARIALMAMFPVVNLAVFRTVTGYVRHPNAPFRDDVGDSWREDDFSSDQAAPLLMGYRLELEKYPHYADEMTMRLMNNRTGDGNLVSPGLWCLVRKFHHLLGLTCLIQALLFLVPLRWSDSNDNPGFQWGGDEGDYLNWIAYLDYLQTVGVTWPPKLCYRLRSPKRALAKVTAYYSNQPQSEWVVDLYRDHLNTVQSRL